MQNERRQDFLDKVMAERSRQLDLPRTELDGDKTLNDWTSIVGYYLFEGAIRSGLPYNAENIEDNVIKAAAVLAALYEHIDSMKGNGSLA